MRLIDADALQKRLGMANECKDCPNRTAIVFCGLSADLVEVCDEIANAPTIDAVPVVRCKDCKHRDAENGLCEGRGWPIQLVPDDGFCDKGERSEELCMKVN